MSSSEANEQVTTSGSQKKIWISKKENIEGTDRRKEKRTPVQLKKTKLRIYMISFFPILVGLQHKPLALVDQTSVFQRIPCGTKFLGDFIFADWRFFVFCGNYFLRLGQTGFSCWGSI